MKKLSFAAALIAITGLVSVSQLHSQSTNAAPPAQHRGWRGQTPDEGMNRLSQALNLTEDQKTRVQGVFDQMRQSVESAVQQAKTNADTQLQQILTQDQYQQLQSMWQQRQRRPEQNGGTGGDEGTGNEGGSNGDTGK